MTMKNILIDTEISPEGLTHTPLVSVIIPSYNRAKLLSNAIDSVIAQTYKNWELIVVDDRSTDNTRQVVERYMNENNRIKYLVNGRSKGPAGARNHGMIHSKGKYIAFLDSDDQWFENHLWDSILVMENEDVKACFSFWIENRGRKFIKFDEQEDVKEKLNKAIEVLRPEIKDNLIFFDENFYEFTVIHNFYCYHINTMVFEKEILDKVGLFEEHLLANEDNDFTYKVFHEFKICLIRDYHFVYNEGDDNLYLFLDRSDIDTQKIIYDVKWVGKLTFNGYLENEMRKMRKKYIVKSIKIKDKSACMKALNNAIFKKYLTLAYLNSALRRRKAIYYLLKSIPYRWNRNTLVILGKIIFPKIFLKTELKSFTFDFG